jgi:hypothetical protein
MGFLVGLIVMASVFCLILPLMAFLYIDILETRNEAKAEMQKIEQLRREVEKIKRESK